ncbi:DUF6165 family protein [Roseibium sp. M-1]
MIYAPISPAELIDKITILEIKASRISAEDKLAYVRLELASLTTVSEQCLPNSERITAWKAGLKTLNECLWETEKDIRKCESVEDFGERFVELARRIYQTNDKRAALKREINAHLGSPIVEVKSYGDWSAERGPTHE